MKPHPEIENIKQGDRFHWLTFIKHSSPRIYDKRLRRFALVKCDCGNEFEVVSSFLIKHRKKRCSDCSKKYNKSKKGPRLEIGLTHKKRVFETYRNRAILKNIEFNLSFDEVTELTSQECEYCGTKDSCNKIIPKNDFIYYYNSIDRLDNNKGYTLENSRSCCFNCNATKSNGSLADFKYCVNRIYSYLEGREKNECDNKNCVCGEQLYNKYTAKCKYYSYIFDLDIKQFNKFVSENCYYCGKYPSNTQKLWKENYGKIAKYSGLCQIIMGKGFIPGNIRPCCRECSKAKLDMDEKDFIKWVKQAYLKMFPYG